AHHSYRYRGEKGSLDYALATRDLLPRVITAHTWNLNADEPRALGYQRTPELSGPWRASDHHPVITDLRLRTPGSLVAGPPKVAGSPAIAPQHSAAKLEAGYTVARLLTP